TLGLRAPHEQVQQVVVRQVHQLMQTLNQRGGEVLTVKLEKSIDEEIVFEQAAPATPTKAPQGVRIWNRAGSGLRRRSQGHGCERRNRGQTARRTISSLILPMAFVGLRPFGHTSTQFMMVW